MDRERIVRTAFERFNEKDFLGALKHCDPDAQLTDFFLLGRVMNGRDAILRQWTTRFDQGRVEGIVADVVEVGELLVAAVYFQAFAADELPIGPPLIASSRFTFDEDRVVGLTHTPFTDIPDDVKELFHVR